MHNRKLKDLDAAPSEHFLARRKVLQYSGAFAATAFIGFDLDITKAFAQRGATVGGGAVDFGTGDYAVLNYAYALEQLEAAFYSTVLERPYRGMNRYDQANLTQIRDHEIAHREFFKNALDGNAIPGLQVNFSRVNFASRESVLTTARTFEDLGVSAYNGAGPLLQNPEYLAAAGTIVSVEARHAAIIRDMLRPYSSAFAGDDVVNGAGLDVVRLPSQVLPLAGPFVATPIGRPHLP